MNMIASVDMQVKARASVTQEHIISLSILCPLSKNMGNIHSSLANQIAQTFTGYW